MEKYKNELKKRLFALSGVLVLYIIVNYIMYVSVGVSGKRDTADFILGFQFGIGLVILGLLIFFIITYIKVLRNEEKLKEMYIDETDERKLMIYQNSGSTGMNFVILSLAVASVLSGYYNTTVFFTLIGACLFVSVVRAVLKLYYKNKY